MASDWKVPRVVVTGAAGWLGRRLVEVLLHGVPDVTHVGPVPETVGVRCLVAPWDRAASLATRSERVEIVRGDVRDAAACSTLLAECNDAVVFHTAAVIHPRRSREFHEVNVEGTRNVLAAACDAGARRVVIVSSNSPFGFNRSREERFDESSPYRPYMGYGRSKMLMEQHVAAVQAAGGIETVVVRAPWFYGPFQPPRQTLFFQMIRDGRAPIVGDGENLRSMAYIDNLCQGLMLAAVEEQAAGQTYWVADEHPYTMNEIIDTVEQVLEEELETVCVRRRLRLPAVASSAASVVDGLLQRVGLYHQKIHVLSEMSRNIVCSVDKAQRELGYRPTVALAEGMRRSVRWCLEQGLLEPTP